MFHRISYEAWTTVIPIIAFVLTLGVFVAITVRALRMNSKERDRMSHLPLEEQPGDFEKAEERGEVKDSTQTGLTKLIHNPFFWIAFATLVLIGIMGFAR